MSAAVPAPEERVDRRPGMSPTLPPRGASWIACRHPTPAAALRLFCLPYAGGSALIYRHWANHLPATVEVCPVELPGRGIRSREIAFTRLDRLVEALAEGLAREIDKPF